ncbi:PKD domain-containing protein [Aliikangiella sp. G2MR2-5]|uniref:PKD domain-containing protein n=1 Tax=Aliikangiella sp. G2MR2-5 TaxID=2788943 RepID=UPI0018ABEB3D|nr:PKD domain-containing protein [Aliikangiella sp. G2MR2-5]
MRFFSLIFAISLVYIVGCSSSAGETESLTPRVMGLSFNRMPVGETRSVDINYGSYGTGVTFLTEIVGVPNGSSLLGTKFTDRRFDLTLDRVGAFRFDITVSDSEGTRTQSAKIDGINTAPIINITSDYGGVFVKGVFDASESYDPNGDVITFNWELLSMPAGSAVSLDSTTSDIVSFVPDKAGDYMLQLTVTDNSGVSTVKEISINVHRFRLVELDTDIVKSEFIQSKDTLVFLGENNNLYFFEISSQQLKVIELPKESFTFGVSNDASRIVVGHSDFVSIIDIEKGVVEKHFQTSASELKPQSIAMVDESIYLLVNSNLYSFDFNTSELFDRKSLDSSYRNIIVIPDKKDILLTSVYNSYPLKIERFDVSSSVPMPVSSNEEYNSGTCGRAYLNSEATEVISSCGNIFQLSDSPSTDLHSSDNFPFEYSATSISMLNGQISLIYNSYDSSSDEIVYFDRETLSETSREELPFDSNFLGRKVFYRANGETLFWARDQYHYEGTKRIIIGYTPDIEVYSALPPVAVITSEIEANMGESLALSAVNSFDFQGLALNYFWEVKQAPSGSQAVLSEPESASTSITPDVKGEYTIDLIVNNGLASSTAASVLIQVSSDEDYYIEPLEYSNFRHIDYSESLDSMIYLTYEGSLVAFNLQSREKRILEVPADAIYVSLNPAKDKIALSSSSQLLLINLIDMAVEQIYSINADSPKIALADNDTAYLFYVNDYTQSYDYLDLSSGNQISGIDTGLSPFRQVRASLDSNWLVAISMGGTIHLYDISQQSPQLMESFEFSDSSSRCFDMWVLEDIDSTINKCGQISKLNTNSADTIEEIGRLPVNNYLSDSHADGNRIAVLFSSSFAGDSGSLLSANHLFRLYDAESLEVNANVFLPKVENSRLESYRIFYNDEQKKVITFARAQRSNQYYLFVTTEI